MSELKNRIKSCMVAAMKAKAKERLAVIRLIQAEIKQYEVNNQAEVDDTIVLKLLAKMQKQRMQSIEQFDKAGRDDLVNKEKAELVVIAEFMPQPMTPRELEACLDTVFTNFGPATIKDLGKLIQAAKQAAEGRADMAELSKLVKSRLNATLAQQ